jgi:2-hydroxy-6-oxonona-2,4-dienedioate hydrolase
MTAASEITAESAGRFVQTKTYRIRYYEAGTGHPLILLHGSGPGATGWSNFYPNIPVLAMSFHVYSIDMPGWGESDSQTEETGLDHVAALIEFMDAIGIDRAALVGNSMGGMTSISTAILHPDRVSHLVTMGAPAPVSSVFVPGGGPSEGMKVLLEAYVEPTAANMKRLVAVMCYDQATATDELAELRSSAALAHPEHLASWNSAYGTSANTNFTRFFTLGPSLPGITAPMLAIHGRDDRVVSYEHSLHLVAAIPNSRLLLINHCGHWAQIEHHGEFNRTLASFLASH